MESMESASTPCPLESFDETASRRPEGVARWMKAAPLGRMGEDEDVADAVLFLASQASRWITGANLVVDGGVTSSPAF